MPSIAKQLKPLCETKNKHNEHNKTKLGGFSDY